MQIDNLLSGTEHPDRSQETIDFETRQFADDLRSLGSSNITIPDLLVELKRYSSVLENNESIALNSGETLSGPRLCGQLGRLFSTAVPEVVEGPSMTWARAVLLAGPSPRAIDGTYQLNIGESRIRLPEEDCMLLVSGRPWQFFNPWPGQHDSEREHASVNMALEELRKVKELVHKVTQELNYVEQRLSSRHYLLSSLQARKACPNQETHGSYDIPFVLDRATSARDFSSTAELPVQEEGGSTKQPCSPQSATDLTHAGLQCEPPGSPQDIEATPASAPPEEQECTSLVHACTPRDTACQADGPSSQSDHQSQQRSPDNSTGPPKPIPSFILKLSRVLDDPTNSDLIRWSDKGDSFVIIDKNSFALRLLPEICQHNNYKLFVSLLWHYKFRLKQDLSDGASRRTSWNKTAVREYTHPHFQRGNEDGLSLIPIRRKGDFNQSSSPTTASDSNFPLDADAGSNLTEDCNQSHDSRNENGTDSIRRGPRFKIIQKRRRIS